MWHKCAQCNALRARCRQFIWVVWTILLAVQPSAKLESFTAESLNWSMAWVCWSTKKMKCIISFVMCSHRLLKLRSMTADRPRCVRCHCAKSQRRIIAFCINNRAKRIENKYIILWARHKPSQKKKTKTLLWNVRTSANSSKFILLVFIVRNGEEW